MYMATIFIPPLLRNLVEGQSRLSVPGATVREVITTLDNRYPGLGMRLCENGRIRPGMSLIVDSVVSAQGLRHPLSDTSEVHFLPAINGG